MMLVTGASGLLGANFVLAASERGHEVTGVYRRHVIAFPGQRSVQADITDPGVVRNLCQSLKPRAVVHCAAATDVDWCEDHPLETRQQNVEATETLATAAHACGAAFLFVSTDAVFDGRRGQYTEADQTAPVNEYGRSKLLGEQAAAAAAPGALILRTNMYGWNAQVKDSLAEWALHKLERGEETPGFEDVLFAPLLVNDLSAVMLDLLSRDVSGLYHAAATDACSKFSFVRQVAEVFGLDASLVRPTAVESVRFRAPRPHNTSLISRKCATECGVQFPSVADGLRHFRRLRDDGFADRLKSLIPHTPHA